MNKVGTDAVREPAGAVPPPGTEPWSAGPASAEVGVLLCHGFTGSPQSMRPWGEYLAERHPEYAIDLPLLPGHGRPWRELAVTGWEQWYATVLEAFFGLRDRCGQVFVMGLSMGGGLALRLAEQHPADVAGLVLVNPSVTRNKPSEALLPVASRVLGSIPAIASDIKKPGVRELGTDRTPLRAAHSLSRFWRVVAADLPRVAAPLLVLRSVEDHVVHRRNSALVLARAGSAEKREILLPESYHVATLDHDAPLIFSSSAEFVERIAARAAEAKS